MKTLGKLDINPEKLIKNEELTTLRGGYGESTFYCVCGMCGGFSGECYPVSAHDLSAALQEFNVHCGGMGVSCSGSGCPQWFC